MLAFEVYSRRDREVDSEGAMLMHDAESLDDDFYSGDDSDDADVIMYYDFMDNDSDDSDELPSHHRFQVSFSFHHGHRHVLL